jgi:hypothetical protein
VLHTNISNDLNKHYYKDVPLSQWVKMSEEMKVKIHFDDKEDFFKAQ